MLTLGTKTQAIKKILDECLIFYMEEDNGSGRIRSLHSMGETYMNLGRHMPANYLRYLGDFAMPSNQQADGWRQLLE